MLGDQGLGVVGSDRAQHREPEGAGDLLGDVGDARVFFAYFAIGLGIGTAFMPLLSIAMADAPAADAGLGSGCTGSSPTWSPSRPWPPSCSTTSVVTRPCSTTAEQRYTPPVEASWNALSNRAPCVPTRTCPRSSSSSAGSPKIPVSQPGEVDHILDIALDGLRYRAQ
jgi:hypothetical protein